MRTTTTRKIGSVGTTARIVGGALFITLPLVLDFPSRGLNWWDAAAVFVVYPLVTLGSAALVNAAYLRRNPDALARARSAWSAAQAGATALALLPLFAVATVLMFMTPVHRPTIWVFVGLSMLLAAARGYAGCEVLAIPNTILRRTDAIWCPIYAPIDTAERPAGPPMTAD
jgi:hypothetical protein